MADDFEPAAGLQVTPPSFRRAAAERHYATAAALAERRRAASRHACHRLRRRLPAPPPDAPLRQQLPRRRLRRQIRLRYCRHYAIILRRSQFYGCRRAFSEAAAASAKPPLITQLS